MYGIIFNMQEALLWYGKACDAGNGSTMKTIRYMFYFSDGIYKNLNQTKYWYQQADNANALTGYERLSGIENASKKSDSCFITIAVCDSFYKSDDCQYYAIAPQIVKNINKLAGADKIYLNIWDKYLEPCLSYIEQGKNKQCKSVYVQMI